MVGDAGDRVRAHGKFFSRGEERFTFRGVTYGTFESRADGALFPERDRLKQDFAAMRDAGFTVVRTYTPPPDDMVELAADWGLHLYAGVFYPDWRYLLGRSRRDRRRVAADARATVREAARRYAGVDNVFALCLGNEVPADVLRWVGPEHVADVIAELVEIVREEDPDQLVSYANYPTAEYLRLDDLDFLTFNVFLERQPAFRRYLTRLHHLAGDRPLVLGEMGLDAGPSELRQADVLEWQMATAIERGVAGTCVFSWTDEWHVADQRVEGWHFGLTRGDRTPRQSLDVATHWNTRGVRDLEYPWPSISVVICAYNASSTLDECLTHTCALDYPNLEIVVVDDGSTDDTADIARRHPRARLLSIEHAGLSVARNAGYQAATGDLIAYLDSDAYPSPEWLYFLGIAFDSPMVGGAGGPNVPPMDDPIGAHQVARAPGGPVHVLLSDDRAEHVPGCNMAFWKPVLEDVDGFDPIYTSAGDDVDLCWKVLDQGYEIGFHPAALVWHHRRSGFRTYLRQQRGYGRAEALVAARHPDRFTTAGTARWRGRIYDSFVPRQRRDRIYSGLYSAAAYQSVYRGGGHAIDLAHQVGVPAAAVLAVTAPLAAISPALAIPAALSILFLLLLAVIDVARVQPPRHSEHRARFRLAVAALHLTQPIVRQWGRMSHATRARRDVPQTASIAGPARQVSRSVLLLPAEGSRAELASAVISELRRAGMSSITSTGWDAYDARLLGSLLLVGDLVTSSHPDGFVQLSVFRRLRTRRVVEVLLAALAVGVVVPPLAPAVLLGAVGDLAIGMWRTGPLVRNVMRRSVAGAS